MYFQVLQLRLIAMLKGRVRNGALTERRLAHLAGISQPHIHNVLHGVRVLSPEMADQILESLKISIFDLFQTDELAGVGSPEGVLAARYAEVPVLEGRVGPGYPFPRRESRIERHPFLRSRLAAVGRPVAARLAADPSMASLFGPGDVVLLDRAPESRLHAGRAGLYVIARDGCSVLRWTRRERDGILISPAEGTDRALWDSISTPADDILDTVLARVLWIGRDMERYRGAGEAAEETGGAHRSADGEGWPAGGVDAAD